MSARRVVASVSALWLVACRGQSDALLIAAPPPEEGAVIFASDLWPGEGIPVIQMQRASVPLRSNPDPGSRVVDTLQGRIGMRVAFDSTRYQTINAGAIEVAQAFTVTGRDLGDTRHLSLDRYYQPNDSEVAIPVGASVTLDLLQHRAEGTCFLRIGGHVIDAQPCPGFGRESVRVVREPATRWWVFARGSGGARGWLLLSDSTARSVRREF